MMHEEKKNMTEYLYWASAVILCHWYTSAIKTTYFYDSDG